MQPITCINILYLIYVVAFSVITIILSSVIQIDINSFSQSYDGILQNWQKELITDIKYVSDVECPSDYSENIINYQWPGTKEGCVCVVNKQIKQGSCCIEVTTCTVCFGEAVKEYNSKNFTIWGIGALKKAVKICVKRIKNYSYQKKVPMDISCEIDEKKCLSSSGSNNFMFCVPNSEPCPIRSVKFELNGVTDSIYTEKVDFPDGMKLLISRSLDTNPLSEFYIGEGDNVCINPLNKLPNKDRTPYVLLKNYLNCLSLDERWQKINQLDEITFYTLNLMKDEITQNLPKYDLNANYYYSLFQRSFIKLDYQCRNQISKFSENQKILGEIVNIMIAITVFARLGITINMAFDKSLAERSFIKEILNQNCVDKDTTNLFINLDSHLQSVLMDVIFAFWIITILTEPFTIFYIYKILKKPNNNANKIVGYDEKNQINVQNNSNANLQSKPGQILK